MSPAEVQTMFWVTEDGMPWHGLGTEKETPLSPREAIVAAGAEWTVRKEQLVYNGKPASDLFLIIRNDNDFVLGSVGKYYHPIQNIDAFSFMDDLSSEGAFIRTAGVLCEGRLLWAQAQIPGEFFVVKDDRIQQRLTLSWRHDGTGGLVIAYTPWRIICKNTHDMAMQWIDSDDNRLPVVRVKHTGNAKAEIRAAKYVMGLASERQNQLEDIYNMMAEAEIDPAQFAQLAKHLFPSKPEEENRGGPSYLAKLHRSNLFNHFMNPINNIVAPGSAWSAYNAVTGYIDHQIPTRAERQYVALFGRGRLLKQRAFRWIVKNALKKG